MVEEEAVVAVAVVGRETIDGRPDDNVDDDPEEELISAQLPNEPVSRRREGVVVRNREGVLTRAALPSAVFRAVSGVREMVGEPNDCNTSSLYSITHFSGVLGYKRAAIFVVGLLLM